VYLYFYRTTRIFDGSIPPQEYLDYLVTAYRQMPDVPGRYIASIAATEALWNHSLLQWMIKK
jgi:hypothetical protein